MEVSRKTKKYQLSVHDIIRYQLLTELVFFRNMTIHSSEMDVLISLAIDGDVVELGKFCTNTVKRMYDIKEMEAFAIKSQNVRNIVNKLCKKGVIDKSEGKGRKMIRISPSIDIHWKGNILLDYNFLSKDESVR